MSFMASIAGPVLGAAVGGIMGNRSAKYGAGAQRYATDQQMRPYNLKEPYYEDLFADAQAAMNAARASGAYAGPTYAGLTDTQREGITGMSGFGRNAMGIGNNLMDLGGAFAQNTQDLYNRASGNTLNDAVNYATSSPQAQSMIEAAMRDSTRQLQEQTLPGIGMGASATGNTNASRAGVADAIAQRSYNDRRADVASDIGRSLTNQYMTSSQNDFNNMMRANQGLSDVFGMGTRMVPAGAEALTSSGGMLQMDQQGQLDADRAAFERQRDFDMAQLSNFNSLLGGLPSTGNVQPITANPYTASLSGMMMGAGFGGNIMDYFNRPAAPSPSTANRGTSYISAPAYQGFGFTAGR